MSKGLNLKKWILILIALILPGSYHLLQTGYFGIIGNTSLIEIEFVRDQIMNGGQALDAIFCGLLIIVTLPFYYWMKKEKNDNSAKTNVSIKVIAKALIIALGVGGLTTLILHGMASLSSEGAEATQALNDTFTTNASISMYIWSLLSVAILGPIVEEILFRGILYNGIDWIKNGLYAAIISGIYFGFWHSMPIQIVYTSVLGIIFGLVYYSTRNLGVLMFMHVVNNFSVTLPPALDTDAVNMTILIIKYICVLPMIYLVYKWVKERKMIESKKVGI